MPKTVKEFKEIFSPIKKPKLPKGISSKDKQALETDANSKHFTDLLEGMKGIAGTKDATIFDPKKRDYAISLIAYKIAKHMDDEKFEPWTKVPDYLFSEAARKIIPNDLSHPPTMKLYEKAVAQKNEHLLKLFAERDPKGIARFEAERDLEAYRKIAATSSEQAGKHLESGDAGAAKLAGRDFGVVMEHGNPLAVAQKNPDVFFDEMMEGLRENSVYFAKSFGDPKLRRQLRNAFPIQWKRLASKAPMLALLDKVDDETENAVDKSDLAKLGRIFDAVLDPKVLPLTYVATSSGYQIADCLSGPSEVSKGRLENLQAQTGAPGPATDCHNLTSMVKQMVAATFGSENTTLEFSSEGKTDGLVLTKPVSEIGGKGLIGKFKGNVVDAKQKPTGQVFYTGDGKSAAHSWIVYKVMQDGKKVGEVSFDPVFGTKNEEIPASIEEQGITWIEVDEIAQTPSKKFIHKVADYTKLPPDLFDKDLLDAIPNDPDDKFYPRNKVGVTRYWTISGTDPRLKAKS